MLGRMIDGGAARSGGGWFVGERVVTRHCLAGINKQECPAGQPGCIWRVFADGVIQVRLDTPPPQGDPIVIAEPCDLIRAPMLPKKMPVQCDNVVLALRNNRKVLPQGTVGFISEYKADGNVYKVKLNALKMYAHIPSHMVTPMAPPPMPTEALARRASAVSATGPTRQGSEGWMSREGSVTSISNLSKQPSYSNLSGSPKARGARVRTQRAASCVTFGTHVSSDDETLYASFGPRLSSQSFGSFTGSIGDADDSVPSPVAALPEQRSKLGFIPRLLRHRNSC